MTSEQPSAESVDPTPQNLPGEEIGRVPIEDFVRVGEAFSAFLDQVEAPAREAINTRLSGRSFFPDGFLGIPPPRAATAGRPGGT